MKRLLVLSFCLISVLLLAGCDGTDVTGFTTSDLPTTAITTTNDPTQVTTTEEPTTEELTLEVDSQIYQIYQLALQSSSFTGTYEDWLETIRGPIGLPGEDGRDIVLQVSNGFIQWTYLGETNWTNLVALADLTGSDGREVTFQVANGFIQWAYLGEAFTNLIDLTLLIGESGQDGNSIKLKVSNGYIQWAYEDDDYWMNLIEIATLRGEKGESGQDAKEVTFQIVEGILSWKYLGDETWIPLLDLMTLVGSVGQDGKSAFEIYLEHHPDYDGDELTWLNDLMAGALPNTNRYTIYFDSDGGEEFNPIEDVLHGTTVNLPVPLKYGYYFKGWFLDRSVNAQQFTNQSPVTKNTFLYAKYEPLYHNVTFVDYDETIISVQNVRHGYSAIEPMMNPSTHPGFIGWDVDFIKVESNMIVRALYEANTYYVYLETFILDNQTIWAFLGEEIELPVLEANNYAFLGWYLSPDFEGEPITYVNEYLNGYAVYARWEMNLVEGRSFEEAYPINTNTLVTVDLMMPHDTIFHVFVPEVSGTYVIQSYGNIDTVAWLYNDLYEEIAFSDDYLFSNFYIQIDLVAGETYYLQTYVDYYGFTNEFDFDIVLYEESTSELNTYWDIYQNIFNLIWGDLLVAYDATVDMTEIDFNGTSVKILHISDMILAVEIFDEEKINEVIDLMSQQFDLPFDYHLIDGTNIIISEIFSIDLIFTNQIVFNEGVFYSIDYTQLVYYNGNDPIFEIPSSVTEIRVFAFYDNYWLDMIYIPASVETIGEMAFLNDLYHSDYIIVSEHPMFPESWNEGAFNEKQVFVWNAGNQPHTYSFVTNTEDVIDPIDAIILIDLIIPYHDELFFMGWYDHPDFIGDPIKFPYYSPENITLYAKWSDDPILGRSFETAYSIFLDDPTSVDILNSGDTLYFKFIPDETTEYHIYTTGSFNTFGWLYNQSLQEIDANDDYYDLNFGIYRELVAGETYYIETNIFNSLDTGTYHLHIEKKSMSDFELIWQESFGFMNEIWGNYLDSQMVVLQFSTVSINDIDYRAIVVYEKEFESYTVLALECNPEEISNVLDYFNQMMYLPFNYYHIENTNYIVTDLLSFDYIFKDDFIYYNNAYYSRDLTTLIKFDGYNSSYDISPDTTHIGSLAFVEHRNLTNVFIPNSVISIDFNAFYSDLDENQYLITTAFEALQPGWHEMAFMPNQEIIFDANHFESKEIFVGNTYTMMIDEPYLLDQLYFIPDINGVYQFTIYSEMPIATILSDSDDDLANLEFVGDGAYQLSYYLEAHEVYYLFTVFTDGDIGEYHVNVAYIDDNTTNLIDLWQEKSPMFYQIWGELLTLEGMVLTMQMGMIDQYSVNGLALSENFYLIIECEPEDLFDLQFYLAELYNFGLNYVAISSNILVLDVYSLPWILIDQVEERVDGYYTGDGFMLIKYTGDDINYSVNQDVFAIGHFAFVDAEFLEEIYIPSNVSFIGDAAFGYSVLMQEITLVTDFSEPPVTWLFMEEEESSHITFVWGSISTNIVYSFETFDGSFIEPVYAEVLYEVDLPIKEGFVFGGWYTDPEYLGEPIEFPFVSDKNIVLYAKWGSGDGSSFMNAYTVLANEYISINPDQFDIDQYHLFIPNESGFYKIYSISEMDPYVTIYNINLIEIAHNDDYVDFNFYVEVEMIAGSKYYIVVNNVDHLETDGYLFMIERISVTESTLDMLITTYDSLFYDIWGDLYLYNDMLLEIEALEIENISYPTLLINGVIGAIETSTEEEALAMLEYLTINYEGQIDYIIIEGTHILVNQTLLLNLIFTGDIIFVDGAYYSSDMRILIRYVGSETNYSIDPQVEIIGPLAFLENTAVESIFIPATVTQISYYAIGSFLTYHFVTILTDYLEWPSGWNNEAFVGSHEVLWGDQVMDLIIELDEIKDVVISGAHLMIPLTFTPEQSGMYLISSFGDLDTIGFIYNEADEVVGMNDDFEGSSAFVIEVYLEANHTYTIRAGLYDPYQLGAFQIMVTFLGE